MVHGHQLLILPSSGTSIINIPAGYHAANGKVTVSYFNGDVTVTIPEGYHDGNGTVTVYPDDYVIDAYRCDDGSGCLVNFSNCSCPIETKCTDGTACLQLGCNLNDGCMTDRRCQIGLDVMC